MMKNPHESFSVKVAKIFHELVGDRAKALDPSKHNKIVQSLIASAFKSDLGKEKADLLGFHMADWNGDAAFMVALHLFPERFTKKEIEAGVISVLLEVTDHIVAASTIDGMPIEDTFKVGVFNHIRKSKQIKTTKQGIVADLSRLQERLPSKGKGKKPVQRRRANTPGS